MPDAPLCPKCKTPLTVYADGSAVCDNCQTAYDALPEAERKGPLPSEEAKKLLAKGARADANYVIRELMAELDVLSGEQFAVKRAELCQRYGLSKSELVEFYKRAHPAKGESKPTPREAPSKSEDPGELPFNILGTANDGLTYFIDRSERLLMLRLGNLTKTQLFLLADRDWWEGMFPADRGRMDLDGAVNYVIKAANGKSFDLDRLRGRGCWREE